MAMSLLRKTLKKMLPKMSQSEAIALEAGGLGFEKEIFTGKPNFDKLLKDLPAPKLTKEEKAFIDGPAEELCKMLDQWAINNSEEADLPEHVWDFIKKNKFLGMEIPKKDGGLGFSHYAHSAVVEKLASRSVTAAVSVMVPNSLGPGELIHRYGTKKQQEYFLPRLAEGKEIPAFALTEPNAGSDATSIQSKGVVFKDEKTGEIKIKLNWEKRYITLGPISTVLGLAFQLEDPDNLLGKGTSPGITAALIDTKLPGVRIGERHRPVDIPFQNGPNWGKDVIISPDDIIGGADMAGQGWKMLMECLGIGRSISLPTMGTAGLKFAARTSGAYSRIRRQFGVNVGQFEGVQAPLARIAAQAYIANATLKTTLQTLDDPKLEGKGLSVASAVLKYHLTEMNRDAINDAMDIHGGKGICQGPNNYLASTYQALPIGITVEGANIMTHTLLIFGQGSTMAHPYLPQILKELQRPEEQVTKKDERHLRRLFVGAIFNGVGNFFRGLFLGITNGRFSKSPVNDKDTKRYYQRINKVSAAFNLSSNIALAHLAGNLKKRGHTSRRLGDVMSNLYMASCVLRMYEVQGRKKEDLPLLKWSMEHLIGNAEEALGDMADNYPNKFLGGLMKFVGMPRRSKPTDKMGTEVIKTILNPGADRDRLTDGIFVSSADDATGKLEKAFTATVEILEPLEKKMKKARKEGTISAFDRDEAVKAGVITKAEKKEMEKVDQMIREVVDVDHFDSYKIEDAKVEKPKKVKAVSKARKAAP